MNAAEISQYSQYHNANMRLLNIGFAEIKNQIKRTYKAKNRKGRFIYSFADSVAEKINMRNVEKSLSRILSGIQVSWAEESIKRLLYEPNLFDDGQRDYLIQRSALDQKWFRALHITFCIAYDLVPPSDRNCGSVIIGRERRNLGNELVDQYFELKSIIRDFLVPNFSIRNKVQHGEWEYAFRPQYSKEFSPEITQTLNHENIITTVSRFTLVKAFYQMLVDMGRFRSNSFALDSMQTPFEYFYKHSMQKIKYEMKKIADPKLDDFINDIVSKEVRGAGYRNNQC